MSCNFSYKHYEEILKSFRKNKYNFISLKNYFENKFKINKKNLIIRHDIDYDFKNILEIGFLDKKYKVKSTFFIRVHSHSYNPFEAKVYKTMKKIIDMGFSIGLHTEAYSLGSALKKKPFIIMEKEKYILETIYEKKIIIAVEHRDRAKFSNFKFLENKIGEKIGIKHNAFYTHVQEFKYLSDSNTHWREGCVCRHINKFKNIYLLTHPELWHKKPTYLT